jgi:hypothetical protein
MESTTSMDNVVKKSNKLGATVGRYVTLRYSRVIG